jgi:hypothetical protein
VAVSDIALRYPSTCSVCGSKLPARAKAQWDKIARTITCLDCAERSKVKGASAPPALDEKTKEAQAPQRPASGEPGASAAFEFQRRHKKREANIDQRFGRFSGVVKFLVDDPQSTRAWAKGASGERELAEALSRRVGDRAVLLHDRKMPRSSANIDHLAIASSGVWIIDAKKYSGTLKKIDKGGWRAIDNRVYVAGRDQTQLVKSVHKQAAVVGTALKSEVVPIHSALCFIGAEWDFFLKPFQIDDVWIIYGKKLAELIAAPGPLSNDEVLRIAKILADALPTKAE